MDIGLLHCAVYLLFYEVLDEADRLLDSENFNKQLTTIFSALPQRRQTLLFSATITDTLEKLRHIAMDKPYFWESKKEQVFNYANQMKKTCCI